MSELLPLRGDLALAKGTVLHSLRRMYSLESVDRDTESLVNSRLIKGEL